MEEILEKYAKEIRAIKIEYDILKDLDRNSETLKKEEEELQRELDSIGDKESGFYKDSLEKVNEKHDEFVVANNERMNKDREINKLISEEKEIILREIVQKKQYIDENRNVNLENVDLEALKAEKEKLEKEIKLNDTTKEEFLKMTDSDKQAVRKAKENYLNNKHRLDAINPTIELMDLLDGKTPKERFIELDKLGKEIEEKFNRDNLEEKFKQLDIEAEEARKKAEEEATRRKAEEEATRRKAEEEAARRKAEEEAARKKAEEEAARKKAEEEAARKKAEEEAARKKAEEEARRKKAEEEARRKADKETAEKSQEVKIFYSAKYDAFAIENIGLGKQYKLDRKDIKPLTVSELALIMDEPEEKFENIEESTMLHLQLLLDYDSKYKTDKAKQYFEDEIQDGWKEARKRNIEEIDSIHIDYNMKGLYKNKEMIKEERSKMLAIANSAKKRGTANVKKGFGTALREKIENILGKFKPTKSLENRGLKGLLPKSKKDKEYDKLVNKDYMKSLDDKWNEELKKTKKEQKDKNKVMKFAEGLNASVDEKLALEEVEKKQNMDGAREQEQLENE